MFLDGSIARKSILKDYSHMKKTRDTFQPPFAYTTLTKIKRPDFPPNHIMMRLEYVFFNFPIQFAIISSSYRAQSQISTTNLVKFMLLQKFTFNNIHFYYILFKIHQFLLKLSACLRMNIYVFIEFYRLCHFLLSFDTLFASIYSTAAQIYAWLHIFHIFSL